MKSCRTGARAGRRIWHATAVVAAGVAMLPLFPSSAAAAPAPATFAPVVDHTIGSLARALVIADVNGNGVLDLVAATSNDGVVVFLGTGDGTFGCGRRISCR